jgi:hypothetical protein
VELSDGDRRHGYCFPYSDILRRRELAMVLNMSSCILGRMQQRSRLLDQLQIGNSWVAEGSNIVKSNAAQ